MFPVVTFKVTMLDGSEVNGRSVPFDAVLLEKHFDAPIVELMPGEGQPANMESFFYWAWLVAKRAGDVAEFDVWAQQVADMEFSHDAAEDDAVPLENG